MKNVTDITMVLDRSGSMEVVRGAVIEGVNGFYAAQRKDGPNNLFTLAFFDGPAFTEWYQLVHNGMPMHSVPNLTLETYVPRGNTALLDAIGRTVDAVGSRLDQMPEQDRPQRVLFAIYTDGLENSSTDYTKAKINEMITRQSKVYSWQFVFLGANQDAIQTGQLYGVQAANCVNTVQDYAGTAAVGRAIGAIAHGFQISGNLGSMNMQSVYRSIKSDIEEEDAGVSRKTKSDI